MVFQFRNTPTVHFDKVIKAVILYQCVYSLHVQLFFLQLFQPMPFSYKALNEFFWFRLVCIGVLVWRLFWRISSWDLMGNAK